MQSRRSCRTLESETYLEEIVLGVLVRIVCSSDNVERRAASQHLVEQDTQGPPVNREPVVLRPEDLRRDVVRCPAECGGGVALADPFLAHPVVGELDVTLVVEEDVVQLEIPADDAPLVQVVQSQAYFRAVEPVNDQS